MPEDDTRSARFPRFAEENFKKNLELADRVREVSDGKGITPGPLALAGPRGRPSRPRRCI